MTIRGLDTFFEKYQRFNASLSVIIWGSSEASIMDVLNLFDHGRKFLFLSIARILMKV